MSHSFSLCNTQISVLMSEDHISSSLNSPIQSPTPAAAPRSALATVFLIWYFSSTQLFRPKALQSFTTLSSLSLVAQIPCISKSISRMQTRLSTPHLYTWSRLSLPLTWTHRGRSSPILPFHVYLYVILYIKDRLLDYLLLLPNLAKDLTSHASPRAPRSYWTWPLPSPPTSRASTTPFLTMLCGQGSSLLANVPRAG